MSVSSRVSVLALAWTLAAAPVSAQTLPNRVPARRSAVAVPAFRPGTSGRVGGGRGRAPRRYYNSRAGRSARGRRRRYPFPDHKQPIHLAGAYDRAGKLHLHPMATSRNTSQVAYSVDPVKYWYGEMPVRETRRHWIWTEYVRYIIAHESRPR